MRTSFVNQLSVQETTLQTGGISAEGETGGVQVNIVPKEGGWMPKRLVVVEFPTLAQAQKWYDSPEYAPLIQLRQKASKGKLVLVEGA